MLVSAGSATPTGSVPRLLQAAPTPTQRPPLPQQSAMPPANADPLPQEDSTPLSSFFDYDVVEPNPRPPLRKSSTRKITQVQREEAPLRLMFDEDEPAMPLVDCPLLRLLFL